jgi:hypothetical protein
MKKIILLLILFSTLFTSCFVNRTTVGYGPVGEALRTRTFSKAKQHYILFGLVRLDSANPKTPPPGVGYEIKSGFNIEDGFFTLITLGLYGQRTVKILVEKEVEQNVKQQQQNQKTGK